MNIQCTIFAPTNQAFFEYFTQADIPLDSLVSQGGQEDGWKFAMSHMVPDKIDIDDIEDGMVVYNELDLPLTFTKTSKGIQIQMFKSTAMVCYYLLLVCNTIYSQLEY